VLSGIVRAALCEWHGPNSNVINSNVINSNVPYTWGMGLIEREDYAERTARRINEAHAGGRLQIPGALDVRVAGTRRDAPDPGETRVASTELSQVARADGHPSEYAVVGGGAATERQPDRPSTFIGRMRRALFA
jgi:hypothetical protein